MCSACAKALIILIQPLIIRSNIGNKICHCHVAICQILANCFIQRRNLCLKNAGEISRCDLKLKIFNLICKKRFFHIKNSRGIIKVKYYIPSAACIGIDHCLNACTGGRSPVAFHQCFGIGLVCFLTYNSHRSFGCFFRIYRNRPKTGCSKHEHGQE